MVGGEHRHVVSYLADFLFPRQSIRAPVKTLSGGERNRPAAGAACSRNRPICWFSTSRRTTSIRKPWKLLEGLLAAYEGTLLLPSHDRAFLDGVVTSVYAFEGKGRVREYVGGYSGLAAGVAGAAHGQTASGGGPGPAAATPRADLHGTARARRTAGVHRKPGKRAERPARPA